MNGILPRFPNHRDRRGVRSGLFDAGTGISGSWRRSLRKRTSRPGHGVRTRGCPAGPFATADPQTGEDRRAVNPRSRKPPVIPRTLGPNHPCTSDVWTNRVFLGRAATSRRPAAWPFNPLSGIGSLSPRSWPGVRARGAGYCPPDRCRPAVGPDGTVYLSLRGAHDSSVRGKSRGGWSQTGRVRARFGRWGSRRTEPSSGRSTSGRGRKPSMPWRTKPAGGGQIDGRHLFGDRARQHDFLYRTNESIAPGLITSEQWWAGPHLAMAGAFRNRISARSGSSDNPIELAGGDACFGRPFPSGSP